jgi:hypothetical protein
MKKITTAHKLLIAVIILMGVNAFLVLVFKNSKNIPYLVALAGFNVFIAGFLYITIRELFYQYWGENKKVLGKDNFIPEDGERGGLERKRHEPEISLHIIFLFCISLLSLPFIYVAGLVDFNPTYLTAVTLAVIFIAVYIDREWKKYKKTEAIKAEARKKEEEQQKIFEEKERLKDIPILIGPEAAGSGETALGWLKGIDRETRRPTMQLKMVSDRERLAHFYVVGVTRMGKTKFLENMILQDAKKGNGFCVIDPHGDLIEEIKLQFVEGWKPKDSFKWPFHKLKDWIASPEWKEGFWDNSLNIMANVVVIDPTKQETITNFNPLELFPGDDPATLADELTGVFKKIWKDTSWGPRLEELMRYLFAALAEAGFTLVDAPDFLNKADFRSTVLARVKDEIILSYFHQYGEQSDSAKFTWAAPVLNKFSALILNRKIRQFFSHPKSSFNLRKIMDSGKILLVRLPKGELKDVGDLLGSLLMAKIQMAAFSRANMEEKNRPPFHLYIDEFQNFATDGFLDTLAESAKYGLFLILAHQNLSQLPERLQNAILGNSNVQIYFRSSHQDAQILARESGERPAEELFDKMIPEWRSLEKDFNADIRGSIFQPYELQGQRWSDRSQLLIELKPRQCIIKNKDEKGAVLAETTSITDLLEGHTDEFIAYKRKMADELVGFGYQRSRQEVEGERRRQLSGSGGPDEPEIFREPKSKD